MCCDCLIQRVTVISMLV